MNSEPKLSMAVNPSNSEELIARIHVDGKEVASIRSRTTWGAEQWFEKLKRERSWAK